MNRIRVFDDAVKDIEAAVTHYEAECAGFGFAFFADYEATLDGVRGTSSGLSYYGSAFKAPFAAREAQTLPLQAHRRRVSR